MWPGKKEKQTRENGKLPTQIIKFIMREVIRSVACTLPLSYSKD